MTEVFTGHSGCCAGRRLEGTRADAETRQEAVALSGGT